MGFDFDKYPAKIEYANHDNNFSSSGIKYKLTIDLVEDLAVEEKHKTGIKKAHKKVYRLDKSDTQTILDILCTDNIKSYANMPDDRKTERGYRDGWHTEYAVCFRNGIHSMCGKLSVFFAEDPFEQVLNFLKKKYSYIEALKKL